MASELQRLAFAASMSVRCYKSDKAKKQEQAGERGDSGSDGGGSGDSGGSVSAGTIWRTLYDHPKAVSESAAPSASPSVSASGTSTAVTSASTKPATAAAAGIVTASPSKHGVPETGSVGYTEMLQFAVSLCEQFESTSLGNHSFATALRLFLRTGFPAQLRRWMWQVGRMFCSVAGPGLSAEPGTQQHCD